MREFQVIQDLLPDLQSKSKDPPADQATQALIREALQAVLGQSAQFLMPILFSSGRLLLLTQAPIWAIHIQNKQQSLIDAAANLGLTINEIKVKVQPVNPAIEPREMPQSKTGLSEQSLASIEQASAQMRNPKLKRAFARLQKRIQENIKTRG